MNIRPRFLIVPAAKETIAAQFEARLMLLVNHQ